MFCCCYPLLHLLSSFHDRGVMASSTRTPSFLCSSATLFFLSLLVSFFFLGSIEAVQDEQESDRVINLPGQPTTPAISQFSGYVRVNMEHGRNLFYWFFEAQTAPSKRPLLLWLNGGPGCSSVGYGAAVELGPLRVKRNGTGLEFNPYAWNREANLLFLESPVGVGFSYTNTSSDLTSLDDGFVAEDVYSFLVNWLRRFPQYQDHDFYISGESYAGHYVPQLAELIYDHNQEGNKYPHINLKGFIVGNPETDEYYDNKGLVEYAWSHSVISDEMYKHVNHVCNFKLFNWTDDCDEAMTAVFDQYKPIDIYNIYAPKCNFAQSSTPAAYAGTDKSSGKSFPRRIRMYSGYDPCFSNYAEEYFNRIDVKRSLHADVSGRNKKWQVCSDPILRAYNFTVSSILPIYSKLIKAGLRIWLYSGDTDGRVPVIGSRYCVEALGLPLKSQWQPWFLNHQMAGRFVEYQGMTMATVRGAGHLVPLNKPEEALVLIHSYLMGQQLPHTQ